MELDAGYPPGPSRQASRRRPRQPGKYLRPTVNEPVIEEICFQGEIIGSEKKNTDCLH